MSRLGARQPAQIALIAPVAIMVFIAVIGLVVDIGFFRLIDSEMENAADAAALAAAWYDPVCPNNPQQTNPPQDPRCEFKSDGITPRTDNDPSRCAPQTCAEYEATLVATQNLGLASALCDSSVLVQVSNPTPPNAPGARAVSVVIECNAPHVVGRILGVSQDMQIYRWGTAALGQVAAGSNPSRPSLGGYVAGSSAPLLAALVPL